MHTPDYHTIYDRETTLQMVREATEDHLRFWAAAIPATLYPSAFVDSLSDDSERVFCMKACLLVYFATNYTLVPRRLQLLAALAIHYRNDSLFYSGTGSGKTMVIAIALLMANPSDRYIVITISPLKRLQVTQEKDFNEKYGIPTLAINEDTNRSPEFFRRRARCSNEARRTLGTVRHFIVTPEQLFEDPASGHLSTFGKLFLTSHIFQHYISHVFVDECHFVHMAGLGHNGLPAFRPSWGRLNEVKKKFPVAAPWHAMTATLPDYMLRTIEDKILAPGYRLTRGTSNRRNIIYVKHQVANGINDLRNYECFLARPYNHRKQPRVLIFFDSIDLSEKVAEHLDNLLPDWLKGTGVVRDYNSLKSKGYLATAHEGFTTNNGTCKIMCATSGQAQGVDFPDVDIVCTVGVPNSMVESIQRGGRGGRQTGSFALFITFYEQWVTEISLDEYAEGDPENPDRTRTNPLSAKATKQERAPYVSVQFIQTPDCLRYFFAMLLNDYSDEAMDFDTPFCSSNHPENPFNLAQFLPGPLFTQEWSDRIDAQKAAQEKEKRSRTVYRPPADRPELDKQLISWVEQILASEDPAIHHGYNCVDYILPFHRRKELVWMDPRKFVGIKDLKDVIDETDEWHLLWGNQVLNIIQKYKRV
ncbi:hypothetical protein NMY22_g14281 [Coprinellus aureogranulatus]|nr:hypothetical protein NMY22_g14281 [Coprinellus aureogranulatus]